MKLEVDISLKRGGHCLEIQCAMEGSVWGVLGASGSGKTTFLNLIAGIDKPSRGHIIYNDTVLYDSITRVNIRPHRRRVGYVFQDRRLFPHLNVRQNLEYASKLAWSPVNTSLDETAELLEIDHLLDRSTTELSGGEQQRVAVARALLNGPDLLLMDEPFAGLDCKRANRLLRILRGVVENQSIDLILVSHSFEQVMSLTDRLAIIENGKMSACGKYLDLLRVPGIASQLEGIQKKRCKCQKDQMVVEKPNVGAMV